MRFEVPLKRRRTHQLHSDLQIARLLHQREALQELLGQVSWKNIFLSTTPSRKCTNPKDYVYAVLGMCHPNELKPGYKLTAFEILAQTLFGNPLKDLLGTGSAIHRLLDVGPEAFRELCSSDATISARKWLCRLLREDNYNLDTVDDSHLVFQKDFPREYFITSAEGDFDPQKVHIERIEGTSMGLVLRTQYDKDLKLTLSWEVVAVGRFTSEVDFEALQLRKEMHIVHTRKWGQDDSFVRDRSSSLANIKLISAGTTIVHSSARFSGRVSDSDVCADIFMDAFVFLLRLGQLHDGWLTQTSWFSFMQIGVWGQQIVFKK